VPDPNWPLVRTFLLGAFVPTMSGAELFRFALKPRARLRVENKDTIPRGLVGGYLPMLTGRDSGSFAILSEECRKSQGPQFVTIACHF
jgi:hypothetical protein